mmetsp:Transcript_16325/g.65960  ORF Transcript_16325/g.65960 Transcript_16325/m.65960 type:complete len:216 (-) Transcript_16325:513-1160(-)
MARHIRNRWISWSFWTTRSAATTKRRASCPSVDRPPSTGVASCSARSGRCFARGATTCSAALSARSGRSSASSRTWTTLSPRPTARSFSATPRRRSSICNMCRTSSAWRPPSRTGRAASYGTRRSFRTSTRGSARSKRDPPTEPRAPTSTRTCATFRRSTATASRRGRPTRRPSLTRSPGRTGRCRSSPTPSSCLCSRAGRLPKPRRTPKRRIAS